MQKRKRPRITRTIETDGVRIKTVSQPDSDDDDRDDDGGNESDSQHHHHHHPRKANQDDYHPGANFETNSVAESQSGGVDVGAEAGGGATFQTAKERHDTLAGMNPNCWGCKNEFYPQRQPGLNKALDEFWALYVDNREYTDPKILANMLCDEFQESIYNPAHEAGQAIDFWSEEEILQHITNHIRDIDTVLSNLFVMVNEMIDTMKDAVIIKTAKGPFFQEKNFRCLEKCIGKAVTLADRIRASKNNR